MIFENRGFDEGNDSEELMNRRVVSSEAKLGFRNEFVCIDDFH